MTSEQLDAVRCAFADLQGSLQAYQSGDIGSHDWKAHVLTLQEMVQAFPFLAAEVTE
jgi:hypothetical protein